MNGESEAMGIDDIVCKSKYIYKKKFGFDFGIFRANHFQDEDSREEEVKSRRMSFNQTAPPTIILLKGDTSQGRGQLISNINACLAIQDTVRTTVRPCF
jgi:hypothetical protein